MEDIYGLYIATRADVYGLYILTRALFIMISDCKSVTNEVSTVLHMHWQVFVSSVNLEDFYLPCVRMPRSYYSRRQEDQNCIHLLWGFFNPMHDTF